MKYLNYCLINGNCSEGLWWSLDNNRTAPTGDVQEMAHTLYHENFQAE